MATTGFVTSHRAAAECGVSLTRIRQLLLQGRVQGAVKMGRQWMVPTPVVLLPPITNAAADITVDTIVFPRAPQDTGPGQRIGRGVRAE